MVLPFLARISSILSASSACQASGNLSTLSPLSISLIDPTLEKSISTADKHFNAVGPEATVGSREVLRRREGPHLKDISSLSSPFSSLSDPGLLCPLLLLAARDDEAGDASLEVAGEDCLERALRDIDLLLSRACLRKSCIFWSTLKSPHKLCKSDVVCSVRIVVLVAI